MTTTRDALTQTFNQTTNNKDMKAYQIKGLYTIELMDAAPTTYEVFADELTTLAPSRQDWDMAKHLCPELELMASDPDDGPHNIYTDGEFYYYCLELLTPKSLRFPYRKQDGGHLSVTPRQVWLRSYMVVTGGITEPAEVDEVMADGQCGFPSLASAVTASLLDRFTQDLLSADNTCYGCYGERTHGLTQAACKNCGGAGFISLAPKDI